MSELTSCNFCNLRRIRARAKENGQKVTLRPGWEGGWDVFVHPPDVKIKLKRHWSRSSQRVEYCSTWLMVIPPQCVC